MPKEALLFSENVNNMDETSVPNGAVISWRSLTRGDIRSLAKIADMVHPDLPEADEVFSERVRLFPDGCFGLVVGPEDEIFGYAISHPIKYRQPPALDYLLGELASDADQYYIHDLAILPQLRGRGLAQECITKLLAIGKRYRTTCLISVHGTKQFWGHFGFERVEIDEALKEKLLQYGEDAVYLEVENR